MSFGVIDWGMQPQGFPIHAASTKEDVYRLSDHQLVVAGHIIQAKAEDLKLTLTRWEKELCAGVVQQYTLRPSISWKQRKALREVVYKTTLILQHRADFSEELRKALDKLD